MMPPPEFKTLEEAVRWSAAQTPPVPTVTIVAQDEYCHDVVMGPWNGNYLIIAAT